MKMFNLTIKINLDNVLNSILAESAWKAAHQADTYCLTRDNSAMLERHIAHAFTAFCAHAAAYVTARNYNPNIDDDNISVSLAFFNPPAEATADSLKELLEQLLASWALSAFYGIRDERGHESIYHLAWRRARAGIMAALAKDCQSNALAALCPRP